MKQLFDQNVKSVEVVYASEQLRQQTRLRGVVEPSLIDLNRFTPRQHHAAGHQQVTGPVGRGSPDPAQRPTAGLPEPRPFTVGRLSRDDPRKHHPDDLEVYQQLIDAGCRVRIMGGTCLGTDCLATPYRAPPRPPDSRIELLPANVEPAETFLHSLDCLFYRTSPNCWEAFGRVIFEAMACGLPVVCHRRGGYITSIDHGTSGLLFDTNDEALAILRRLQSDPALRTSIGASARAAVEAMFSPAERAKVIDYYLM